MLKMSSKFQKTISKKQRGLEKLGPLYSTPDDYCSKQKNFILTDEVVYCFWRHHPESNRATELCRPLHNRSAMAPSIALPETQVASKKLAYYRKRVKKSNTF